MSRWKWLSIATIAGLLFTLTACKKETPPPDSKKEGEKPVALAPRDPTKVPDDGVEQDKRYAESVRRESRDSAKDAAPAKGDRRPEMPALGIPAPRPNSPQQDAAIARRYLGDVQKRARAREEFGVFNQQQRGQVPAGAGKPGDFNLADNEEHGNTENYQPIFENPFKLVKHDALSTISSAVDTAAYSNLRARLNAGQLPPRDAVRIADMLNYFHYDYPGPKNDEPVAFSLEIAPCPWQPKHHLLRVGLKAKTIDKDKMPPRSLTFLIDTSGSMNAPNRLPLVKQSLRLLVEQLTAKDKVSIVTYAGNAGLALPPTPGDQKELILRTIENFNAGGSTNGEGGLKAAYEQAKAGFIKEGVNRVILATDGDFNVGISSDAEMVRLIEEKRGTGVFLTVLGYGMGNLKDSKLEQLAHHGNGHYAYIDSIEEARKVFVDQGGSLVTVAKDVKLQVEFNPAKVSAYRLVGYENRILRHEDFRDDKKDAGDMGSGHMCTALYEIVPVGEKVESADVEPLKYQTAAKLSDAAKSGEWATVRMRYKHPETDQAKEVESALAADALGKKVSNDFEFAACVASFGMLLRDSEYRGVATYASCLETASGLVRDKKDAHREEFVKLVRVALTIDQKQQKPPQKID